MTTLTELEMVAVTQAPREPGIYIVFDGPPSHESGRFVEVENETGASIHAGEWRNEGDFWALGPFAATVPFTEFYAAKQAALRADS